MAEKAGNVVIVGGGIIGCSIAYHLSELNVVSTIIEKCSIACGASGKAGGFLARTWCDGGPSGPLARASFDLHKKYGAMFNCDYRAMDTLEVSAKENSKADHCITKSPEWLDKKTIENVNTLGNTSNTAQVHPWKLANCFFEAAKKKGCKLLIGEVVGVEFDSRDNKCIKAVQIKDKESIACDLLILAMGPWTNDASPWFQYHLPVISAQRAHSIVMKPSQDITAHALFLQYRDSKGKKEDPEIYPRPDGTVYMCGFSDQEKLPENADLVQPNNKSVKALHDIAGSISSALKGSEVITEQACFLPLPPGGAPVIGRVPGYNHQVYIAAGHYCWGILNAPATGKYLAELIVNGHSTIDLSSFDPANFL